ncbi:hypothetical protein F511_05643 [Dorcoceras hygrometricum]|uniref:Uncharacterized protein n=1 Tax=Dorcoceras hygrometricum TaxID=472368 RepID=A0A2Z7BAA5_9LAMI|nr:hypothetical protein F511_05643 [Dorcoceras hygrometricum]
MSLFDLQDVRIVIGSLATLDIPMVIDLIEIYVLKGPYCTLTMTNWFLQALSVIPRPIAAPPPAAGAFVIGLVSISVMRRFRPYPNSPALLVQTDEGLVFPVVDLIRRIYRRLHLKSQIPCEFGWSQAPRRQQGQFLNLRCASGKLDPDPTLRQEWYQSQGSDPSIHIVPELRRISD